MYKHNTKKLQTSYVTVPPDVEGWRSVTVDTAPLADKMHIALGPCWENATIFVATSCREGKGTIFERVFLHF